MRMGGGKKKKEGRGTILSPRPVGQILLPSWSCVAYFIERRSDSMSVPHYRLS